MFREIFDYVLSSIKSYFVEEAEFITDDIISIPYYWCGKKYRVYCKYDKTLLDVPEDIKVYIVRADLLYNVTQQPGIIYNDIKCDKYMVEGQNVEFFADDINESLRGLLRFFES